MKGKVKFFNSAKGFGFIAGDDGKEYFVHQSALAEGLNIGENDAVTFDVVEGDRGPKADKVALDTGGDSEDTSASEDAPAAEETTEETTEEKEE